MSELINKPAEGTLVTTEKPAYLANREKSTNLQQMAQQIRPPRLKFIQANTGEPFKPPFKDGDGIISPNMILVMNQQVPMTFTPLYYYVEYVAFNPNEMKGSGVAFIRERTMDPESLLAKKCEMFANEPYPNGQGTIKYRKVHIWLSVIHGFDEIRDQPVILAFRSGPIIQNLMLAINKRDVTDMCACRFRGVTYYQKGKINSWWSMAIDNDVEPFVDEQSFLKYAKFAKNLEDLVAKNLLVTEYDDDELTIDNPANEKKY